jgi:hypothetical protein
VDASLEVRLQDPALVTRDDSQHLAQAPSRSWGSRAWRNASAAARYSGERLAGMSPGVSGFEVCNAGRMCQVMGFRRPPLQRGIPCAEDRNDER